MRSSW